MWALYAGEEDREETGIDHSQEDEDGCHVANESDEGDLTDEDAPADSDEEPPEDTESEEPSTARPGNASRSTKTLPKLPDSPKRKQSSRVCTKRLTCPSCSRIFKYQTAFNSHVERCIPKPDPFAGLSNNLKSHIRKIDDNPTWQCINCNRIYKRYLPPLVKHLEAGGCKPQPSKIGERRAEGEKKFQCERCGKGFTRTENFDVSIWMDASMIWIGF